MKLLAGLLFVPVLFGQVDAIALLRQSVENYDRDWRAGLNWAFTETDISQSGGDKDVSITEVIPIAGAPYDRVIEKNSRKLTGDDARREQEKFEKTCREREKQTPAERAALMRKMETQRAFAHDVPLAYDAKLLGEDTVDGRPAWVLELTPRADYQPSSMKTAMFRHISAKLWIDKQDVRWAKAQAHVIDTISIGWVMARIGPGADITFEQTRVSDGLWLPKKICIQGVAKIFLVHDKDLNETITFSGFHQGDQAPVLTAQGGASKPPVETLR